MTVTLRPMPESDLPSWLEYSNRQYEAERIAAGDSAELAAEKAAESRRQFFPDGHPATNHHVFQILEGDTVVGYLWMGPLSADRPDEWWGWDFEIDAAYRGKGIGRAAMTIAENTAREYGAKKIGLNVFGHNTVAQNLYRSFGFTTTAITMWKQL